MNLPNSRNDNCAPNTPVRSSLLNALQDCIIGAKHPELEIGIDASGFVASSALLDGSGSALVLGDNWSTKAYGISVVARLDIPVGTRITTITISYANGNAGNASTLDLNRKNLATGVISNVATLTEATAGAVRTATLTANHTIASGYAYTLKYRNDASAGVTGGSNPTAPALFGATVKVDRL